MILGELLAQVIESGTGLAVERRLNLGGTFLCDRALRSGQIDGYVEYTGTAWTAILKREPIRDPAQVLAGVREAYARAGLEWLEPLGFNNTFAILVRGDDARRLGLKRISDAAPYAPGWVAGFGYEFIERRDGLPGLAAAYHLRFREAPRIMELGLIYRALAAHQVDLIAGDRTSGLIQALDLVPLEDDRHYFPPYDAVPVFRRQTLERHPELRRAILGLGGALDEAEMRSLNAAVDARGGDVDQVVREFLASRRRSGPGGFW